MVLVDANVLLYAVNESALEHAVAQAWLARALQGGEAVAFAWTVALAFLRLSTNPSVFPRPLDAVQATNLLERWLGAPPAVMLEPTFRHLSLLRGLLEQVGSAGNVVSDAHLAALAFEHGATVVSFDRDFARFGGLAVQRPS